MVRSPSGTQVSHVYPASSPAAGFTVKVTAVDPAGNASQAPPQAVQVLAAVTEPDPQDPPRTALAVGGTAGNDTIVPPGRDSENRLRERGRELPPGCRCRLD
jgi:hypothetical protein